MEDRSGYVVHAMISSTSVTRASTFWVVVKTAKLAGRARGAEKSLT